MNINDAVSVLDDLCGQQGLYSVAWKMIRTRLYEEVQKPAPNKQRDEIRPCGWLKACGHVRVEKVCKGPTCNIYDPV